MSVTQYRSETLEAIGRKILWEYDHSLLEGDPRAIPIESIIEIKFNLILEYHSLRKNGSVLGETIFDDGAAVIYDLENRCYRLIAVKAGTILIEERLCNPQCLGRLKFTCAHELSHWVLHKNLYTATGEIASYNRKNCCLEERQADLLATALLMPPSQVKKCFYRMRQGKSVEQLIAEMARIFEVSKQAMRIQLESHRLI